MQLSGKVLTTSRLHFSLDPEILFPSAAALYVARSNLGLKQHCEPLWVVGGFEISEKSIEKKLQYVLPFGHFPKNKKSFSCSCGDNCSNVICVFFCKTFSGKKQKIFGCIYRRMSTHDRLSIHSSGAVPLPKEWSQAYLCAIIYLFLIMSRNTLPPSERNKPITYSYHYIKYQIKH